MRFFIALILAFLPGLTFAASSIPHSQPGKMSSIVGGSTNNCIMTASGVAGNLPQCTDVYIDDSGNVGIGTTSPSQKLHISQGDIQVDNTTFANQDGIIYKGSAPFIYNFNYGDNGTVTTDGNNTFVGENAGNLTMGSTATETYHSSNNTFIGKIAGYSNTTGNSNSFIGVNTGQNNTTGYYNSFIGRYAGQNNTTGYYNSFIGVNAGQNNTTGYYNSFVGVDAGRHLADGSSPNETGGTSLFLGNETKALADGQSNQIVIGYNATGNGSNSVVLGNDSIATTVLKGNVGIGTATPTSRIHGDTTLDDATGDEVAYTLDYTTNKLTSGDDTGLLINQTDTASPGASYLIDAQVGGSSKFYLANTGAGVFVDDVQAGSFKSAEFRSKSDDQTLRLQTRSFTVANNAIEMATGTASNTTGEHNGVVVSPTINQTSGDANNNIWKVNPTLTAEGSGGTNLAWFGHDDTARMVVESGGNVGIGTTSPGAALDIDGTSRFGDSDTNYVAISTTGEVSFAGAAKPIDHVTLPVGSLGKGGIVPDAATIGYYAGYSYDIGDDSIFVLDPGHTVDFTEDVELHVTWAIDEAYATNSGEVQWRTAWSSCQKGDGEALDACTHSGTTDTADIDIPATAKYSLHTTVLTIPAASIAYGDILGFNLSRVALDDGNNPTADPVVIDVHLEHRVSGLGTY